MSSDLRTLIERITWQAPSANALLACARQSASYQNLLQQMDRTAQWLTSRGMSRTDRVAVVMGNGPEMASLFLGIASVAVCAPLDPSCKRNEFEFYLAGLRPKLVIVDERVESLVRVAARELNIEVIELRRRELEEAGNFVLGPEVAHAFPDVPLDYPMAGDVALLLYTSGTTSRPKMVPLTHENLCVSAVNIAKSLALTASDRCLNIMPLFHIHGLVGAMLSSLSAGASVVCTPGYIATEFFDWLAEFHPTWYTGVPTMHHGILTRAEANRAIIAANPLRFIRSCSAALAPKVMGQLEDAFDVPVLEAYGMTEAAHQIASNGLSPEPHKPGFVGRPTCELAIMADAGELLPDGAEGEVVIRGRNVTHGYEDNPDANLKSFTNGWFRTGDRGYLDSDGDLFLTGRIKELIVRGGEKIAPREIDEVLLAHPAVEQALGFAWPDAVLGEKVAAAVVLRNGASATEWELCEHAAGSLADFKVPEKIVFVTELPRGPTGKLQRIGLAEKLGLSGLPAPAAEYCGPRDDPETRLAEMWRQILKLEHAGIHDNFFHAGGDSILAAQLSARIRYTFGTELSLPRLFQLPTIEKQAEFIGRQSSGDAANLPLPSVARTDGVLLTSAQQRMWFLSKLEPGIPLYNRPFAYRLKGTIDLFHLQQSLSAVALRHRILRTNYCEHDGVITGVVRDGHSVSVALVDLSDHGAAHRESAAAAWMGEESSRPFNLETDQMLRCAVARLAPDEHLLLLVMHHIACDASTEPLILRDLADAYNGTLPDAPCAQYADYAAWQHSRQAAASPEDLTWWKQQLAGMDELNEMPCDFIRLQGNRYCGRSVPLQLDAFVFDRCKALASAENMTVFTVLLAAFDVLLHRYRGGEEVVVGTPVAVRNHLSAESMVGLFINTLVLRTSSAGNPTFREFLDRVRETVTGGLAHQEVPFDAVIGALRPGRCTAHASLFQVMFEYRNINKPKLLMEGIVAERVEFDRGLTPFDLTLDIEPGESGLRGHFYYNSDLFAPPTIERMAQHFEILLGHAIQDPDEKISQLRLVNDEEQAQVLAWGRNTTPYPDACVQELFEEQVAKNPDADAVVFEGHSLSYAELNRRANRLAHYLIELGARPDGLVAICVERGFEMIVGLLAILKAGGAYVPLDPAYPVERLCFMFQDSAPVALLTQSHLEGLFLGVSGSLPVIDLSDASPPWQDHPQSNPDPHGIGLSPQHLAYVIYTSGSTGTPKGVQIDHGNLTRLFSATEGWFHFGGDDVWSLFHSYAFDFSAWEIWGALLHGGRLVVVPKEISRSAEDFYRLVCLEKITVLNQTPSAFRQFIEAQSRSEERHQLRIVVLGGEALEIATLKPWYEQNHTQPPQLVNMYGITETTVHVTYLRLDKAESERRPGASPIGCPIPDLRTYILDAHGQPVPIGITGELYIGGAGVARGYLNRPELTAERFLKDPFAGEAGARMYRTGDLGRWLANGNIEFLGRNDFQVKIRGFRIELGEIEARLAKCPGVREGVVIVREDEPGDQRLVAYYTSTSGENTLSADQLRAYLAANLPDYMVPTAYVGLRTWPLTCNGKLDRKALPTAETSSCSTLGYEPPRSKIETAMRSIWADVLQVENVGKHDNFFQLGGHSLVVGTLLTRVRHSLGVRVPVAILFEYPTLHEFSCMVAERIKAEAPRPRIRSVVPLLWVDGGNVARELTMNLQPISEALPIWMQDEQWESLRPPLSLESVARLLVNIIRDRYPDGPYMIGGRCISGVLAYETAQQLLALGCDVALLVLVESRTRKGRDWMSLTERLMLRLQIERLHFRNLARAPRKQWGPYLSLRLINLYERIPGRRELRTHAEWIKGPSDQAYIRILTAIGEHYEAKPYTGRLAYFQAKERLSGRYWDSAAEWRPRVGENGEFHEIPGDHGTVMNAGNIGPFGEQLRQTILRVEAETATN